MHLAEYAELLAHAHTPAQFPIPAVAASVSGRAVPLKERLETMKYFADTRFTLRRRVGVVAGAGATFLAVATVAACAGSRDAPAAADPSRPEALAMDDEEAAQGYVIPLSIDPEGPVQYTRVSEHEAQEEIARLEIQVEYLRERIEVTSKAMDELDPPDLDTEWSGLNLRERFRVLHTMRREVVKRTETVKLAYETQKRMRNRS